MCTFSHSLDFGNALGSWWEKFPRSHDLMRQKGRRWFSGVGGCVGIYRNTRKKRQEIGSSPHPAVWKSSSCVVEELSALPLVGRRNLKSKFAQTLISKQHFISFRYWWQYGHRSRWNWYVQIYQLGFECYLRTLIKLNFWIFFMKTIEHSILFWKYIFVNLQGNNLDIAIISSFWLMLKCVCNVVKSIILKT